MNATELNDILEKHRKWLKDRYGLNPILSKLSGFRLFVLENGMVFSFWSNGRPRKYPFQLKPRKSANGYYSVSCARRNISIHRLVADAFLGDINGKQVHHINSDRSDNRISNLRVVTQRENHTMATKKRIEAGKRNYAEYRKTLSSDEFPDVFTEKAE